MENQANFNSIIRTVHSISTTTFTPQVDSYYESQNGMLHYEVEVPGVRRGHIRVVLGYSPLLRHKSITMWGVSIAPQWPNASLLLSQGDTLGSVPVPRPLVGAGLSSGQSHQPSPNPTIVPSTVVPIVGTIDRPLQRMMEQVHGEFYRLLNVPAKTQVSDINVILAYSVLSIRIKCDEPLTANEIQATQEIIEVH
ncbi:hypothetical protein C8R41DRAFT_926380 [Lentinula lateritia]|uniref:Uncharacterized protein n=1 Tax=Lentinula lateritia TaxID=40482 RepID=A0ABQ8V4I5_9AGAR|nr:hypothetical protein C8R41DRAFT_926380 [Lentinula lateritia]